MKFLILAGVMLLPSFNVSFKQDNDVSLIANDIQTINPTVGKNKAYRYANRIYIESKKRNISPALVMGIIQVESEFKHDAVGKISNDFGPMQINEFWLKKLNISKKDLMTVDDGIAAGVKVLDIKRKEIGSAGCWWSIYNTRDAKKRHKYQVKVNKVVASIGEWFDCAGVKSQDLTNFSAWEARTLVSRRLSESGISATKTNFPMRLVVNNMGSDQVLGKARTLTQFRD